MIKLSLNFSAETTIPSTIENFEKTLNTHEFQEGFKIVGTKIVPFYTYNNREELVKNKLVHSFSNVSDLYGYLRNKTNQKTFYILKVDGEYRLYVDDDIDSGRINVSIERNISVFKKIYESIVQNIKGKKIDDPYLEEIIYNYLETELGYKNRIASVLEIRDKANSITVKVERYLEENGGNPEDVDYYKYGGAMSQYKETIKKEDLK